MNNLTKIRRNNGKIVEYQDEYGVAQIIIRNPVTDTSKIEGRSDYGFIHSLLKTTGKEIQIDNAELDSDVNVNFIFNNSDTKIVLMLNDKGIYDYIGFSYLDTLDEHRQLGYTHYKSLHGLIRSFKSDEFGTKTYTSEFYRKIVKNNILTKILDEYFQDPAILIIDAWLPDFLKWRRIYIDKIENTDKNDRKFSNIAFKDLPAHKILKTAGFKCPYTPLKSYCLKNGKPCDIFVYQLSKKFFRKINKAG